MQDGDKATNKFDIAKVMTKPDGKGATATIQAHPQFRAIGQPMRVVTIPPSSSGGTQIIQTQLMPNVQTMIKQVDNRITVSRPLTPTSYHVQRGATVTNIQAPRGATPIRTPTPPASVTNITPTFVRTSASPRAPSSTGTATLIPQGTNWISSTGPVVQVPTQLIRANITQSPRPRVVTQTIPQNNGANVVTQQTVQGGSGQVYSGNVIAGSGNQTVGGQPALVATLSIPPRQQGAALVYSQVSNANQTPTYNPSTQRLTVATALGTAQRQVRPLQRLPTTGIGVRVSTANLSIRQNVPVLATIPSQTRTTTSTTNLTQIPARIIQPSTTAQVINARGMQANVMTLQPIIVNNRYQQTVKTQIPQALTIAHVGKLATPTSTTSNSAATITVTNLPPGGQSSQQSNQQLNIVSGTVINQNQIQTQKSPQIAHILSVNQPNVQPQQHQIIQSGANASSNCGKGIPLVTVSVGSVVQANVIRGIVPGSRDTPIAKVLPSRQIDTSGTPQGASQSVFIHTTPPNVSQAAPSSTVAGAQLSSNAFISHPSKVIFEHMSSTPTTSATSVSSSFIDSMFSVTKTSVVSKVSSTGPISTVPTMITTQAGSDTSGSGTVIASSVSYTPSGGSFAVVPSSNRNIGPIHVSSTSMSQANQIQAVPVRFNPQLIVDGSQSHSGAQIIAMSNSSQISTIQSSNSGSLLQSSSSSSISSQSALASQPQMNPQTHIMIPASVTKVESPRQPVLATSSVLRKRDIRGSPVATKSLGTVSSTSTLLQPLQSLQQSHQPQKMDNERSMSPHSRPPSTDGSTTVSATSSPNLDQQELEERASMEFGNRMNDFFNSGATTSGKALTPHQNSTGSSSNGVDPSPRKRSKRVLMPNENVNTANVFGTSQNQQANNKINNNHVKNQEVTVKKPQSVSLLQSYKQTWKAANNHFQRYSDVRPRDDRRPNVMDLANQPNVTQKVNGWKLYHLSSQIEELCEMESQVYDKLASQLASMEAHNPSPDVDRVSELLKGNMQRGRIIIDGINDAKSQLMKVFDHKTAVSDIIQRCASKRNFKKREKP